MSPNYRRAAPSTAHLIGAKAHRILRAPGFSGVVLTSGSGATYIADQGGEIFGISPGRGPAHTRMVLTASAKTHNLSPGMRVRVQGDTVLFEDEAGLDLSEALVWDGQAAGPGVGVSPGVSPCISPKELARSSRSIFQAALDNRRGDNLVILLPLMAGDLHLEGMHPALPTASPFISAAIGPIGRIAMACWSGQAGRAISEAHDLIGLGPGLTPSGDDFTGGLLFAAWHLGRAYPSLELMCDAGAVGRLIGTSASRTNRISHAFLTDFAEGQGPGSLHDLMDSLLTGQGPSETMTHIRQVAGIGHTSGRDMLAGLFTGLLLVTHTL